MRQKDIEVGKTYAMRLRYRQRYQKSVSPNGFPVMSSFPFTTLRDVRVIEEPSKGMVKCSYEESVPDLDHRDDLDTSAKINAFLDRNYKWVKREKVILVPTRDIIKEAA